MSPRKNRRPPNNPMFDVACFHPVERQRSLDVWCVGLGWAVFPTAILQSRFIHHILRRGGPVYKFSAVASLDRTIGLIFLVQHLQNLICLQHSHWRVVGSLREDTYVACSVWLVAVYGIIAETVSLCLCISRGSDRVSKVFGAAVRCRVIVTQRCLHWSIHRMVFRVDCIQCPYQEFITPRQHDYCINARKIMYILNNYCSQSVSKMGYLCIVERKACRSN